MPNARSRGAVSGKAGGNASIGLTRGSGAWWYAGKDDMAERSGDWERLRATVARPAAAERDRIVAVGLIGLSERGKPTIWMNQASKNAADVLSLLSGPGKGCVKWHPDAGNGRQRRWQVPPSREISYVNYGQCTDSCPSSFCHITDSVTRTRHVWE